MVVVGESGTNPCTCFMLTSYNLASKKRIYRSVCPSRVLYMAYMDSYINEGHANSTMMMSHDTFTIIGHWF